MPITRRELLLAVLACEPLARSLGALAAAEPPDRVAEIEWHILFLTNQQRIWRRLPPLEPSAALADIARSHSLDMLTRAFFDYRNPEGLGPEDRIARHGLRFETMSENIYLVKGGTTDAAELASLMVTGWMNSKGHRQNILDPDVHVLGAGAAVTTRLVLATELFAG